MPQTDELDGSQMQLDNSSKENLDSLVDIAHKLLHSKAQMRNKLGQFVPDPRWITNDEALFRYVFRIFYILLSALHPLMWCMYQLIKVKILITYLGSDTTFISRDILRFASWLVEEKKIRDKLN